MIEGLYYNSISCYYRVMRVWYAVFVVGVVFYLIYDGEGD